MYGQGEGATGGRSIKVEDITEVIGYDPETSNYANNYVYEYGNKVTYYWDGTEYPYYEAIDREGNIITGNLINKHDSFNWYDTESKSWKSSQKSKSATEDNQEKITTLQCDYYTCGINRDYSHGGTLIGIGSDEFSTLFTVSAQRYWLASQYVWTNAIDAALGLRYVDTPISRVSCDDYCMSMYYSDGRDKDNRVSTRAVRVVVTLDPNINITGGDGSQGEGAYQIQ